MVRSGQYGIKALLAIVAPCYGELSRGPTRTARKFSKMWHLTEVYRGLMSRINRVIALVAGLVLITAACGAKAQDATPNDVARFLAGMQPSAASPLAAFTRSPSWQRYAKWFDSNWSGVEQKNLSKVRAWAEQHVKNQRLPLYYMFSGPDYLYADAFFPSAATYLLSGLEPVGTLP